VSHADGRSAVFKIQAMTNDMYEPFYAVSFLGNEFKDIYFEVNADSFGNHEVRLLVFYHNSLKRDDDNSTRDYIITLRDKCDTDYDADICIDSSPPSYYSMTFLSWSFCANQYAKHLISFTNGLSVEITAFKNSQGELTYDVRKMTADGVGPDDFKIEITHDNSSLTATAHYNISNTPSYTWKILEDKFV